jgi:sec-independent protein translocase protein TatA
MPDIGVPELLIVLVIIVLVFGVGKLPEVGASMGKAIRGFKRSMSGADEEAAAPMPPKGGAHQS